jgi:hypothetical protein
LKSALFSYLQSAAAAMVLCPVVCSSGTLEKLQLSGQGVRQRLTQKDLEVEIIKFLCAYSNRRVKPSD